MSANAGGSQNNIHQHRRKEITRHMYNDENEDRHEVGETKTRQERVKALDSRDKNRFQ
jgi:hypothetical protein